MKPGIRKELFMQIYRQTHTHTQLLVLTLGLMEMFTF